ncbi:hypothetical protein F5Y19DRAFT_468509 [Xylariaceae sp. FL1651]|nr:hypothetical protein F5Y19DRAFT_468509 [Xylariaceae sp. FL1651]
MGEPAYATPTHRNCPFPNSDKAVTSSSASSTVGRSPVPGRDSASSSSSGSEQMPTDTQRGNRRRKSHSPEAWEAVKSEIARLYLDEGRRLKDVMAIMEERRGFWASLKMYKTKLTQWKFFKNNRQADVANLLYLQKYRQTMGKGSTFQRNGKPVNVAAYMRRKGLRVVDLLEGAHSCDLPPTLRCRTPPPPLPMAIEAPDDYLFQEAYIYWSTDNPLMPPLIDATYFKTLDLYHSGVAMEAVMRLTHGCWLFSIGRITQGGAFCQRAFETINHVLEGSAHFAVYELMSAVGRYPDLNIIYKLWTYLDKYATTVSGVSEGLKRLLRAFAKLGKDFSLEHNVAMAQWGRRFSSEHGSGLFDGKPFDYSLIQPWDLLPMDRSYHHRYYINQIKWEADAIPTATIPSLDASEDPWYLRADLLLIFGNQTAWADDRISSTALKMLSPDTPQEKRPDYLRFVCLYALARSNRARCQGETARFSPDHKLAREYLRKAAEVQREAWEAGKNYYETLTLLESWHREAGDENEAKATRMKREVECQKAFENLRL